MREISVPARWSACNSIQQAQKQFSVLTDVSRSNKKWNGGLLCPSTTRWLALYRSPTGQTLEHNTAFWGPIVKLHWEINQSDSTLPALLMRVGCLALFCALLTWGYLCYWRTGSSKNHPCCSAQCSLQYRTTLVHGKYKSATISFYLTVMFCDLKKKKAFQNLDK
jgi:hypothetical protein